MNIESKFFRNSKDVRICWRDVPGFEELKAEADNINARLAKIYRQELQEIGAQILYGVSLRGISMYDGPVSATKFYAPHMNLDEPLSEAREIKREELLKKYELWDDWLDFRSRLEAFVAEWQDKLTEFNQSPKFVPHFYNQGNPYPSDQELKEKGFAAEDFVEEIIVSKGKKSERTTLEIRYDRVGNNESRSFGTVLSNDDGCGAWILEANGWEDTELARFLEKWRGIGIALIPIRQVIFEELMEDIEALKKTLPLKVKKSS